MDIEFLSKLLISTRAVGVNVSIEQLHVITKLSKLVETKGDDITIKDYMNLMDEVNKELKPPEAEAE